MLTALRRSEPVTIEAFDNFVSAQADATLFELVEGVIVMMTNPTETHEQITSNIGAPLKLAMDPRGCRTYQRGIRVLVIENLPWRDGQKQLAWLAGGAAVAIAALFLIRAVA